MSRITGNYTRLLCRYIVHVQYLHLARCLHVYFVHEDAASYARINY